MHLVIGKKSRVDRAFDAMLSLFTKAKQSVGGGFDIYPGPASRRYGLSGQDRVSAAKMIEAFTSLVFACIHVRAKTVADVVAQGALKPYLEQAADTFKELPLTHPLYALLRRPNPDMTRWNLWYTAIAHLDLTGNAYWWIAPDRLGRPRALWPLLPPSVTIIPGAPTKNEPIILRYDVQWPGGGGQELQPETVVHLKYPNPADPYYNGLSLVMRAAIEADIDKFIKEHQRDFFANDATPAGIITFKQPMVDEQRKAFEDLWLRKFQRKPGQIGYLEGDATYTPLVNQKELDYLESAGINRKGIQSVFGVPDSKLMLEENISARATLETLDYNFLKETISPLLTMIAEQLSLDLAQELFDPRFVIRVENVIPRDQIRDAQLDTIRLDNGTTHINEIRERDGMPLYIGGEEPLIDMGKSPLSRVTEEPEEPEMPGAEEEAPEEEQPEEPEAEAAAAARYPRKVQESALPEEVKAYSWQMHERLRMRMERRHAVQIAKVFRAIAKQVVARIESAEQTASVARELSADGVAFDIDDWTETLRKLLGREGLLAIRAGFEQFLRMYEVGGVVFSPNDPAVVQGVSALARKTKTILGNYRADLVKELNRGLELQETNAQLAGRVSKFFTKTIASKATRIARTNSNYAVNIGNFNAAARSGIFNAKVWITQRDDRVRDLHQPLDGVEVPLKGYFDMGNGDQVQLPGDPTAMQGESVINCRCTVFFRKSTEPQT